MIETLLCVASPVQQLTCKRAGGPVDVAAKINNVRDDQFRSSARRRRSQVRDKIADGEINFMTDCRDNRYCRMENSPRDDLFVELPQVFDASAAPSYDDHIDRRKHLTRRSKFANSDSDFLCGAV